VYIRLESLSPLMDLFKDYADASLFQTLSSQREYHYRSFTLSQASRRLNMFDDISGDEIVNKSIMLPLSGQNSYINSPVVVNIPLNYQSKEASPGVSITAYSNILIQPLLHNNSFSDKMNNKMNNSNNNNNSYLFDTGRLLSDMVRIDII
jgi:hypothetical protein